MVIRDFIRKEAKKLSGSPSAALFEVEVLAAHTLGISRSALLVHGQDDLSPEQATKIAALVDRRAKGEPSAYLTGEKEFMGLLFKVGEGVLIPRPDTETLVEWALQSYQGQAPHVLDICTGSGAIAVSIARLLPGAKVTACDISDSALAYSKENAEQNGVSLTLLKKDILKEPLNGTFDLIVSNPPYIPKKMVDTLGSEVKDHEPRLALEGGEDGLLFYPVIAKKAYDALASGGRLAVEIGFLQGSAVSDIFKKHFKNVNVLRDLAGNDRVVIGEK